MPRFLHTADWQIGRQFAQFPPDSAVPLAQARTDCVAALAALATQERVDAVLVAGDVFDTQTVSEKTLRRLFRAMEGYAGPWVLLPGNHDAALAESVWSQVQRLGLAPAHVHLALKPQVVLLPQAGLAVLPAPLTQRHTHQDLTQWFDHADTPPELLRVGLAHGCVQGLLAEGIDSANPLSADRTHTARLDFLALGDWHGTRQVHERAWYSGTPEPDRFRNNDAGQALLVEIAQPGALPTVEVRRTGRHTWLQHAHALSVATDADVLAQVLGPLDLRHVVDLRLTGRLDLPAWQGIQALLAQTEAKVRCLMLDTRDLQLAPSDDDIAGLQTDGYLGEALQTLRQEAAQGHATAPAALALLTELLTQGTRVPVTPGT